MPRLKQLLAAVQLGLVGALIGFLAGGGSTTRRAAFACFGAGLGAGMGYITGKTLPELVAIIVSRVREVLRSEYRAKVEIKPGVIYEVR